MDELTRVECCATCDFWGGPGENRDIFGPCDKRREYTHAGNYCIRWEED